VIRDQSRQPSRLNVIMPARTPGPHSGK
jgi:hypothetical protein